MNHFYYDVSDLNARWDQVPLQGLGGGILSAGPIGTLGGRGTGAADSSFLPWKEYSAETLAAQRALNKGLKADGYCPIDEDGKLGAATCGAARQQWGGGGIENCQAYTAPVKCPGGAPPPSNSPPPSPVAPSPVSPPLPASMSGDNMWLLGGAVAAAAAVGLAFFMKKKKKR
jgi:hypothetical protein